MARKAYIGVNGVARNIPKMYTGAYFGGSAGRTECIISSANSLIYSMWGRNYIKAYSGDAYAAFGYTNGWLQPLLVSRNPDAVAVYTNGNYESGVMGYETTVTFRGSTWYVCSGGAAFQTTDIPSPANVVNINAITGVSSFSTREEAALALLNYVNWLPAGNNIARKITKGYVGVNGVARQFYPKPSVPVHNELIVSTANQLILSVGTHILRRDFYKVNANPAICAYQKFVGVGEGTPCNYWSPILISEDPEAVKISYYDVESDETTELGINVPYQITMQYSGKTWYVTRELGAFYDLYGRKVLNGINNLNELTGVSSYSSPDAGALDLLKYYYNDI